MGKNMNEYIINYRKQLKQGDIQVAYEYLRKYVMALRTHFVKELGDRYSVGNVSPGYMDYTYFPFFDDDLRGRRLRFGIILNHRAMRFELWLLGQNAEVQKDYWLLLKSTKWNEGKSSMPQYSVLEAILVEEPDFDNQDALTEAILTRVINAAIEIQGYIKGIE